ncbi:MAG: transcription antitermination factor NusB [Gammaproteobacteria bacterium]|nr:transcription antitermination factor NusB [Gammaproteobacteria bacterium]
MSGSRSRTRQAVVQALYQWQVTAQPAADISRCFLRTEECCGLDEEYFAELIREVPGHVQELDALLAPYLDRPLAEVDPVERAILRLGAYEFLYHPEIGYRIVLNEAVELAKVFGGDAGHKFVNAVLDRTAARARPHEARPRHG